MVASTLVGRSSEVDRVLEVVAAEPTAVMTVSGPAGIGKSCFVAGVEERLVTDGWYVVTLTGTAASADLPLGVWSPWLPATATTDQSLALAVTGALQAAAGTAPLLIIADDVNLLDDASAALLHQLTLARLFAVLLARRRPPVAGEPLEAVWNSPRTVPIALRPLADDQLAELVGHLIGHPLTTACAAEISDLAHGNALYAREIALAALDVGSVEVDADGRAAIALPSEPSRLSDLLSRRMEGLSPGQRAVMVQLAFGEPLGPGELTSDPEDPAGGVVTDLVGLEQRGLVRSVASRRRVVLGLAHPLYGEILRRESTPLQRQEAHRQLAGALAATGTRRHGDATRLAAWSLAGGVPIEPELLLAATRSARMSIDLDLAEQFAATLHEVAPSFESGRLLAEVLSDVGDLDRLDAHLPSWERLATDDNARAKVAINRATTDFWQRGDARAPAALAEAGARLTTSAEVGYEVVGVEALLVAMEGKPRAALERVEPVLGLATGRALGPCATATAHALQSLGRPLSAIAVVERAINELSHHDDRAPGSDYLLDIARLALVAQAGRIDEAAEALSGSAHVLLSDEVSLVFAEALIRLMQGRFGESAAAYERADLLIRRGCFHGNRRWALGGLALSHAQLGDLDRATATLAELDRLGTHPARIFDSYVWQARAWSAHLNGDPDHGRRLLADGAADCRGRGDVEGELGCLYHLARMGDAALAAPRARRLADGLEGLLLPAMADHIVASAAQDADGLRAASEELAECGAALWAAEASAEASSVLARHGMARAATALTRRSIELRRRCEVNVTPSLVGTGALVPLTRRERDVVVLAAQGMTSRAIGERLFVSTRTVESHLARSYTKLGVTSRAELTSSLDGGLAHHAPSARATAVGVD